MNGRRLRGVGHTGCRILVLMVERNGGAVFGHREGFPQTE